jgi:ribosome-binding ATPase YchF (GTP1/OBG family)
VIAHARKHTRPQSHARTRAHAQVASVAKIVKFLEDGHEVRNGMDQWTTKDVAYLNDYSLLTAKPVVYGRLETLPHARGCNMRVATWRSVSHHG